MLCTESTPSAALNHVHLTRSTWKFHHIPENFISACPCHPDPSKASLMQPVLLNSLLQEPELCQGGKKSLKNTEELFRSRE